MTDAAFDSLVDRFRATPFSAAGDHKSGVFQQVTSVPTSPVGLSQDIGFTPSVEAYMVTGLRNADLAEPPPDLAANLDDVLNKVPEWSFVVVSGTHITAKAGTVATNGSGYGFQFNLTGGGAAGDSACVEQIKRVVSTATQKYVYNASVTVLTTGTVNAAQWWMEAQPLAADDSVLGSPFTNSGTLTASGASSTSEHQLLLWPLPPTTQHIRIRYGLRRGGLSTATAAQVTLADPRVREYDDVAYLVDSVDPAGVSPFLLSANGGTLTGVPGASPNYLVGTADASIPSAIVVGTTPGGQLGGTWSAPTVDASHSGSAHPQAIRVSAGSVSAGTGTDVTVTWPVAFADANYTVALTYELAVNDVPIHVYLKSKIAASCVVRVFNQDASARTPTIHAIGTHD